MNIATARMFQQYKDPKLCRKGTKLRFFLAFWMYDCTQPMIYSFDVSLKHKKTNLTATKRFIEDL